MAQDGRRNKLSCLGEVARSPGDEALSFKGEQRLPVYEMPTIPEGKDQPMTPGEEFTYQKDPLNISYHSQPYRRRRHRHRWKSKKQVSNVEDAISPSSQILPPVTKPSGRTPCARKSGGSMTYLLSVHALRHVLRILPSFPI